MKDLVKTDGKKAFTTSQIIAEGSGIEHRSVMRLIREHAENVNDISLTAIQITRLKTAGRSVDIALLDEAQATFLISLMKNSKTVVKFKKKLTQEFFRMRDRLAEVISRQRDENWLDMRKDGKIIHRKKTDIIKQFTEYATNQGSQNAVKYYTLFARMENSALFFLEQKFKNVREIMLIRQLMIVSLADDVVEKAIQDGMDKKLDYHDIYKLAKERTISFANTVGKSPIMELAAQRSTEKQIRG